MPSLRRLTATSVGHITTPRLWAGALSGYSFYMQLATHAREAVTPTGHEGPSAIWLWLPWTVGLCLVTYSFRETASHFSSPADYVAVFWFGMALVIIPVLYLQLRRDTSVAMRGLALGMLAVADFLPKLLLTPWGGLYAEDELAHWYQTKEVIATGRLFTPNHLVPIAQDYPGLHSFTAAVSFVSGLSAWHSGQLIIFIAHSSSIFSVFLISRALGCSIRAAGVAGVLYSVNASYLYFDSMFSYESLGVPMALATIYLFVRATQERAWARRAPYLLAAVALGATCDVTHHLSAIILGIILLLWTIVGALGARLAGTGFSARSGLIVAGVVIGLFVIWVIFVAPSTVKALSPFLLLGTKELAGVIGSGGKGAANVSNVVLNPIFEHYAGIATPVLTLILMTVALVWWLRRWRTLPNLAFGAALAGVYLVSVPFEFSPIGYEGAHRSWALTFLGVALFGAPVLEVGYDRLTSLDRTVVLRAGLKLSLLVGATVMFIGNVESSVNLGWRFPLPPFLGNEYPGHYGSLSSEELGLASWAHAAMEPNAKFVGDEYSSGLLGSYAREENAFLSRRFPAYELFFYKGAENLPVSLQLRDLGYEYLVVDTRTELYAPAVHSLYLGGGPVIPTSATAMASYMVNPWTVPIYSSSHYLVYRFNWAAFARHQTPTTAT